MIDELGIGRKNFLALDWIATLFRMRKIPNRIAGIPMMINLSIAPFRREQLMLSRAIRIY